MSKVYQECSRTISRSDIKCCLIWHFHQSQHNRYLNPLDDVALLQIAVLQQDLLERDAESLGKRGLEDPEDIRPIHGWHRREGGCMDIMPD